MATQGNQFKYHNGTPNKTLFVLRVYVVTLRVYVVTLLSPNTAKHREGGGEFVRVHTQAYIYTGLAWLPDRVVLGSITL